jgi:hypothetical protein
VPSRVYDLFSQAMIAQKQVLCLYDGYPRELCPIILGHSNGQEKALTYQFAGQAARVCPAQASGAASGSTRSAMFSSATGPGVPAMRIPSPKAASNPSTSM